MVNERELTRLIRWGRSGEALRGAACPEEESIAGYVDGRLNQQSKLDIEDHLAKCRFCLGQVGVLSRLLQEGKERAEVPGPVLASAKRVSDLSHRSTGSSSWRWAVGAAGLVMAAMLALAVWLPRGGQVDPVDGSAVRSQRPILVGPALLEPLESASIPLGEIEFRWTEVPDALSYQLHLVTDTGDIVWSTELDRTRSELPAGIAMEPGAPYFVWVRALLPDGRSLRSTAVGFQVQDR